MKAYSINADTQEAKNIDIEMQPNTVFTFFNSILTDELSTLESHTIHTDANAISNSKKPFFIGEQLVVGDVLIVGKKGLEDVEVSIPLQDLKTIINYNISDFYLDALHHLQSTDLNLYRMFEIKKGEELIELNAEWVLYVFNLADVKTKEYFLKELQNAVESKEDILSHIQNMAVLALQAGA